jgi:gliding motility-associated-like protein
MPKGIVYIIIASLLFCGIKCFGQYTEEKVQMIDERIIIPNAFSPNDDGFNDKFRIFYADDSVLLESFVVFNRFGQVLFETNDLVASWDGKYKNISCPEGVYVFMIAYKIIGKEGVHSKRGTVTLVR